jgi:hypothetical protein
MHENDEYYFYWNDTIMDFDTWIKRTTAPEYKKAELILIYG